jgi:hypothetical protein
VGVRCTDLSCAAQLDYVAGFCGINYVNPRLSMFALKVKINDAPPVTGGANDLGVLSAILTCSGKLGPYSVPSRGDETQDFTFRLGGLTSRAKGVTDEHLVWLEHQKLKPGDRVLVEIIETEEVDAVRSGREAEEAADDERAYFEHCKQAYFDLRDKYESEG